MNYCQNCLVILLCVVCSWSTNAQQVDSGGATIFTRVGCYQELRCTGVGTRIAWRLFGVRMDLENSTNYYILTESKPIPGSPGLMQWTSRLVFPSIPVEDSGSASYSCSVYNDPDPPQQVTVQLNIATELMTIDPPIQNQDISSYYVGDSLLIGCPVHTCARGVTVQFLLDDVLIATGMPSNTDESVYTTSIPMTFDTPGTYTCLVTADAPDGRAFQMFNITGTPMLRPTPTPGANTPVSDPPGSTGATPTLGSNSPQMTTESHGVQLSPTLSLYMVLVLWVWLYFHRL